MFAKAPRKGGGSWCVGRPNESSPTKAREQEREREQRALRTSTPPTYELTLASASKPGLPPPRVGAAPGKVADDPDQAAAIRFADDTVLTETEKILADYVGLLRG